MENMKEKFTELTVKFKLERIQDQQKHFFEIKKYAPMHLKY